MIRVTDFTDDDFLAQVVGAYVAGFETSSDTTMFILYELALNMDIQENVRKEILDALAETDGKITYELVCILNCRYRDSKYCLEETAVVWCVKQNGRKGILKFRNIKP